jgi:hypothetical protein
VKLFDNSNLIVYWFASLMGWTNAFGQFNFANDDLVNVSEDVSVRINILHNDDGDAVTLDQSSLKILNQPAFGVASLDMPMIVYTPAPDYFGRDSFLYEICSFSGECDQAMIRIQVHAINDAPVAVNDHDTLDEDKSIVLYVTQNDSDKADNLPSEQHGMFLVQMPNHGDVQIDQDQLIYTPKPDYYGNDYLRYAYCDEALCDTAIAHIHVRSINDRPVANDDYLNTLQDLLLVFDPLKNDHDSLDLALLEWSSITMEGLRQPSHGFAYVDLQVGLVIYVPDPGFTGTDTFEYRVCDQGPDTVLCDSALVYVTVQSPANLRIDPAPDKLELIHSDTLRQSGSKIITKQQLQSELKKYIAKNSVSPGIYRYLPDYHLDQGLQKL